jgi:demethylmenaquinone methyltransferase/2-methoxy-6-polyprenyl-1,4-benzoquinol methylase
MSRPRGIDEETTHFGFRRIPVKEKAGYVRRHFNSIAGKYDFMNTFLSFGLHYYWKWKAVSELGLQPGSRVIDVCGGTADLSILAAGKTGLQGRIVLYDINRAMLDGGKSKIMNKSMSGRIFPVQGDAEAVSFADDTFDAAMVGFGIRNVTRMEQGLAEMQRVLKPGGRFMCLEFSLPAAAWFRVLYDFYSFRIMPLAGLVLAGNREAYLHLPESIRMFPPPDVFIGMLKKAGFSRIACRRLTGGIAMIYTGEKA